jgi:hypothetical protein
MRTGVTVHLSPTDRKRLQAIIDDRNSPQKHVWRARIVLATADGLGTLTIMRTAGVSKTAVWRWQARFMDEGIDGLLRDKTRPARVPKLADDVAERIVALTLAEPPDETTHWTGRVMAKVAGVRLTSVQRIWKAHGLAPHRIRTFKLSNDPKFAARAFTSATTKPSSSVSDGSRTTTAIVCLARSARALADNVGHKPVIDATSVLRGRAPDRITSWRTPGAACARREISLLPIASWETREARTCCAASLSREVSSSAATASYRFAPVLSLPAAAL